MSTRIIGAIIMVHGDDSGLVLPPRIAPTQVMVIPIAQHKDGVLAKANEIYEILKDRDIRTKIDISEKTPGYKFSEQEMLGIPIRIEIGPKDIEQNQCVIVRRDTSEKITIKLDEVTEKVKEILELIQKNMYDKAKEFLDSHIYEAKTMDEFKDISAKKIGFVKASWCGDKSCEENIKLETNGFGSRCILENEHLSDKCVYCGKDAKETIIWGKSY